MSIVNLVSGGLDSTLIGAMAKEEGIEHFPLFVDYGQRAAAIEWLTCQKVHLSLALPVPIKMDLSGFGQVIVSGLTNQALDVKYNAFTPGRNLLLLLAGSAYAHQVGASAVAIGLLSERFSLFPDQRINFINHAQSTIQAALGQQIKIITPLSDLCKKDVIRLASMKAISGTYSCHTGNPEPCGHCISCMEFKN